MFQDVLILLHWYLSLGLQQETLNIMTNVINNRDLDSHIIIIELQLRGVICTTRKNVYTLKHVQLQNIGLVMKCIPALNN